MSNHAEIPEDPVDPVLGLSIASIVNMPLVAEDDIRSQGEVDQLILAAMLDQARREYAGAKVLFHLVLEVSPDYEGLEFFHGKVQATRRVVELFDRLLKIGLADPDAPASSVDDVDDV